MDGWHGDEYECVGKCRRGVCGMCDDGYDTMDDNDYEYINYLNSNGG